MFGKAVRTIGRSICCNEGSVQEYCLKLVCSYTKIQHLMPSSSKMELFIVSNALEVNSKLLKAQPWQQTFSKGAYFLQKMMWREGIQSDHKSPCWWCHVHYNWGTSHGQGRELRRPSIERIHLVISQLLDLQPFQGLDGLCPDRIQGNNDIISTGHWRAAFITLSCYGYSSSNVLIRRVHSLSCASMACASADPFFFQEAVEPLPWNILMPRFSYTLMWLVGCSTLWELLLPWGTNWHQYFYFGGNGIMDYMTILDRRKVKRGWTNGRYDLSCF